MNIRTANIEERLGKFFLIRIKSQPDVVLEIRNGESKPSVPLVLGFLENDALAANHQLWFIDRSSSTIRSKLNSYCIDFNGEEDLVVNPYMGGMTSQQWEIQEDGTIREKDFDNVVTTKNDSLQPGSACHVTSNDELIGQQWSITYLPATFFVIRHSDTNKVLDIKGDLSVVGGQIITYALKQPPGENQLWYEDQNGVIHSCMNDFVINVVDMDVLTYPYDSDNAKQQWGINGRLIQDRCQPSRVLESRSVMLQAFNPVLVAEFDPFRTQQNWSYEEVPQNAYAFDHGGKGKYFLINHSFFDVNLTVDLKSKSPPYSVELSKLKLSPSGLFADEQLFFFDRACGVIRSKSNERCCLEVNDSNVLLSFYQNDHFPQQLEIRHNKVNLRGNKTQVLTIGITNNSTDPGSMQCYFVEDIDSHHQHWSIRHATAQLFFIESKGGGKVLEIKREGSGYAVVMGDRKAQTRSSNQLWYEDELGILRSKSNGFVLDTSHGSVHADRFNSLNPHQGWIVSKEQIRNRNSGLVLDTCAHKKWMGSSLGATESGFSENQRWIFLYA